MDGKFSAPEFGIDLIDRRASLGQLEAGRRAALVLIHGPAGYGKTTLLVQWRRRLAALGMDTIWLTLDEDDRVAERFIESVAVASGDVSRAGDVASGGGAEVAIRALAVNVLTRLGERQRPLTVILDDYHRAQSPAVDKILAFLIDRAPSNMRIAVASRTVPAIPLAALRSRGQLCEISAAALSFSLDETRALFTGRLSESDTAALHHRLEGWPVALQLAQIWLGDAGGGDNMETLLDLSRDDIANFLTTQVLAGFSPPARQILTATAIVEEFSADLARALCDIPEITAAFEELRTLGGLVLPVRRPDRWYRCHQLLRDFLADRLALSGEDNIRALHRRAADWFYGVGDLISAVRHAVRAQDTEGAARRIEAAGAVRIGLMSGLPTLSRLMGMVPLETIYRFPRLQVARAWMLAKAGALGEGRECYEDVRPAVESLCENDPIRHEGLFVDMMLSAVYEDDARALSSINEIERLARKVSQVDHWFQGWINNLLAIIHTRSGALANAREAAMAALSHYRIAGSTYGQVFMRLHLAIIATLAGRLSDAADVVEKASRAAEAEFPADLALRGLIAVVKAQVLYERNQLSEAEALLDEALPNIQHAEGWVEIYVRGFQTRAAIAYVHQGLTAALSYLDAARAIGEARRLPRLIWFADCRKTELLTLAGKLSEAATYAAGSNAFLDRDIPSFISWRERKRAIIAKTRLAIRQGEAASVRDALQSFRLESEHYGRDRALMEISLLEALAAQAANEREEAIAPLKRALAIAVPEHFLRTFVDEGEPMAQLLRATIRHIGVANMPTVTVTFIAEVLAAIAERGAAGVGETADILSIREIEVLRHLAFGHANKVIARALDLTEATVKFHLGNIYRKLGVSSRVLAVAVAREKQLLDPAMTTDEVQSTTSAG